MNVLCYFAVIGLIWRFFGVLAAVADGFALSLSEKLTDNPARISSERSRLPAR